ncbi:MAG: efflux transporter outer membrane subunit [Caulobacteraceae bacterium]
MLRADRVSRPAHRAIRAAVCSASMLALAACNFAPAYTPPNLTLPTAYKEAGLWTQAQPGDALPRGLWWTPFQDATLDNLEGRIDSANPTLAAALAAYDQSRALAAQARSAFLPTITGLTTNTYNRQSDERPLRGAGQPDDYANNSLGGEIDYEFDFWGRIRNLVASGEAVAQASAADLATAQLSLHIQLANTYLQLRGLDAQTKLLLDTVSAYKRALNLTVARHNGGVSSGLDVDRAQAQLSSAIAQVSDVAAQRALYEHAIASLVGQAASTFSIPAATVQRLIPTTPAGVPSTLIQRRPDIAAAERRAYAANRQIGVARAAYFPTITLDAQAGFENTGGNALLIAPNTFFTIGPQLALTLFDGGKRKAGVAVAKAAFLLASANYKATVLSAFQQVEDQLALSNHYAVEASDQAAAVKATEGATNISLIRYREGATNYLDVVTAQTAELQAEQTALGLETRRQQASVNLVLALGGGWSTDNLPDLAKAGALPKAVSAF